MKKKIFKLSLMAMSLVFSATVCFSGEVFQAGGTTFSDRRMGRMGLDLL